MKRFVKCLLLLVSCILLTSTLCSCDYLDELKEMRIDALDEDRTVLEYKGNKYMLLENPRKCKINTDDSLGCYVVDSDVPLLWLSSFGYRGEYSARKNIIMYREKYYCTLDKHEEYQKILNEADLDSYCCIRYLVDYENMDIYSEFYIFPEELNSALREASEGVGKSISKEEYNELDRVNISQCDKAGLLYDSNVATVYIDDEKKTCGLAYYGGNDLFLTKELPAGSYEKYSKLFKQLDYYNALEELYGIKDGELILEPIPA